MGLQRQSNQSSDRSNQLASEIRKCWARLKLCKNIHWMLTNWSQIKLLKRIFRSSLKYNWWIMWRNVHWLEAVMKPTLKGSKMRKHVGFNVGKFRNPDTLQNRIRSGVGAKNSWENVFAINRTTWEMFMKFIQKLCSVIITSERARDKDGVSEWEKDYSEKQGLFNNGFSFSIQMRKFFILNFSLWSSELEIRGQFICVCFDNMKVPLNYYEKIFLFV